MLKLQELFYFIFIVCVSCASWGAEEGVALGAREATRKLVKLRLFGMEKLHIVFSNEAYLRVCRFENTNTDFHTNSM